MSSTPVLKHPDFSKVIEVACDASCDAFGCGTGEVLSQERHHIAFFSEKLSDSGRIKHTPYKKDVLEILLFTL